MNVKLKHGIIGIGSYFLLWITYIIADEINYRDISKWAIISLQVAFHLFIFYRVILGNVFFKKFTNNKHGLLFSITAIVLIFSTYKNLLTHEYIEEGGRVYEFSFSMDSYFEELTGINSNFWPLVNHLTIILLVGSLAIALDKFKNNNKIEPAKNSNNESLHLLLNLKESGKLSAEDFFEEVKKLNEK
jgi:hypothetical protein